MFKNAIRLVDVFGFHIRVDPSWLIIATLIVWSLSSSYFPGRLEQTSDIIILLLAVIAMLAMFACLILHELSHALVARRFNLKVGNITLFMFGGVAELEQDPRSAKSEFYIAIAGPLMSFSLFILFYFSALFLERFGAPDQLVVLCDYLAFINFLLGAFNLIPAFPLDGGRVLRASIWHYTNDLLKATLISSRLGTFLGWALVIMGVLGLFQSQTVAGIWQILIGFFVITASQTSYADLEMKQALRGKTIDSIMTRNVVAADVNDTIQHLIDHVIFKENISFVPVLDHGKILGYVDAAMLQTIDRENWPDTRLEDIFTACNQNNSVEPKTEITKVFELMTRSNNRKMLVIKDERLVGVVSLADLMAYLAIRQSLGSELVEQT